MRNYLESCLRGYVLLSIKSEKAQRFFHLCGFHGLVLWNIDCVSDQYQAYLSVPDLRKLQPICRKTHTKIHILEKHGLPFFFYKNRKRKAFFVGIVLCMCLLYGFSTHIWQIQITGNHTNSTPAIRGYLDELEVFQGVQKNRLNCAKISAAIREEFQNITWVSTKIEGTKLLITVQENDIQAVTVKEDQAPSDLVAEHTGKIVSMVTRQGVPLKKPGDTCKKGETLVRGQVEIKNDSQEVVRYEYVDSDADVKIEYQLQYEDIFPLKYQERVYEKKEKQSYGLWLGNWRVFLGREQKAGKNQDSFTQWLPLGITKGFPIPVYLERRSLRSYQTVTRYYSEKEARQKASERLQNVFEKLLQDEIEIVQSNVKTTVNEKSCISSGKLTVREIAKKKVQIQDLSQPEQAAEEKADDLDGE